MSRWLSRIFGNVNSVFYGHLGKRVRDYIILIGPMPPPHHGTSVPFEIFVNFIKDRITAIVIDTSQKYKKFGDTRFASIGNIYAFVRILLAFLYSIPRADRVLMFGSNQFLCTFGLVTIFLSKKIYKKKVSVKFFGGSLDMFLADRGRLHQRLIRKIFPLCDKVVLETKYLTEKLQPFLNCKLCQVPNYRRLNITQHNTITRLSTDGVIRLVYAGDINEEKGIFILIEAFLKAYKQLKEKAVTLLLDFYGELYEIVSGRFFESLKASNLLEYKGRVPHSLLMDKLPKYDIMVFPTLHKGEGHPGVVLEAMIAGVPIIATRFRSIPELITHMHNGYLVTPGDIDELSEAIVRLALDKDLRCLLAKNAKLVAQDFSVERVIPKLATELGIRL